MSKWVPYNEHDELVRAMQQIEKQDQRIAELERELSRCITTEAHNNILRTVRAKNEKLRALMQEFVTRCETGSVRSKYTYAKFKAALEE